MSHSCTYKICQILIKSKGVFGLWIVEYVKIHQNITACYDYHDVFIILILGMDGYAFPSGYRISISRSKTAPEQLANFQLPVIKCLLNYA